MARWRWRTDDVLWRHAGGGGRKEGGWRGFEATAVALGAVDGVLRPWWVPTIGLLRKLLVNRRRKRETMEGWKEATKSQEGETLSSTCTFVEARGNEWAQRRGIFESSSSNLAFLCASFPSWASGSRSCRTKEPHAMYRISSSTISRLARRCDC